MWAKWAGPLLVAAGALLWATDTPFRFPLTQRMDPTVVVLLEHIVGAGLLSLWILAKKRAEFTKLKPMEWLGVLFIGTAGSALATILFTASFKFVNPSITILLQKLQPILVVLIASVVLKEMPERRFFGWAALAVAAAGILCLPSLNFAAVLGQVDLHSKGVMYALAAAGLWAVSTVVGKLVLNRQAPDVVTYWRYLFGLAALLIFVILAASTGSTDFSADSVFRGLAAPNAAESLLYLGAVPGLLAMLFYYNGLARTPASVATFLELLYPVGAILLNTFVLKLPLDPIQLISGGVLLFAVGQISR